MITDSGCNLIFDIFKSSGFKIYAVGGCVRDSLLGLTPKDIDFCTDATPEEMKQVFESITDKYKIAYEVIPTGEKFGTLTLRFPLLNENYEITTFRNDGRYSDSRHPDSVSYAKTIEEDLSRRDFTCNAIAWNPDEGYIDPFNGIKDIENNIITCVGKAEERFEEDPLRVLRLVRFAIKYNFDIRPDTLISALKLAPAISKISLERIGKELVQILSFNKKLLTGSAIAILCKVLKIVGCQNSPEKILSTYSQPLLIWYELFGGKLYGDIKYTDWIVNKMAVGREITNGIMNLEKALQITKQYKDNNMNFCKLALGKLKNEEERLAYFEAIQNDVPLFNKLTRSFINKEPNCIEDLVIDGEDIKKIMGISSPNILIGAFLNKLLEEVVELPSANKRDYLLEKVKVMWAEYQAQ